jgi:hypothetical protein
MKLNFYEVGTEEQMLSFSVDDVPAKGHIITFDDITDYVVLNVVERTDEADVIISKTENKWYDK